MIGASSATVDRGGTSAGDFGADAGVAIDGAAFGATASCRGVGTRAAIAAGAATGSSALTSARATGLGTAGRSEAVGVLIATASGAPAAGLAGSAAAVATRATADATGALAAAGGLAVTPDACVDGTTATALAAAGGMGERAGSSPDNDQPISGSAPVGLADAPATRVGRPAVRAGITVTFSRCFPSAGSTDAGDDEDRIGSATSGVVPAMARTRASAVIDWRGSMLMTPDAAASWDRRSHSP